MALKSFNNQGEKKVLNSSIEHINSFKDSGEMVWNNDVNNVISTVTAVIPYKILILMREVEKYVRNGDEFGVYLKGQYSNGILRLSEDYNIPEQYVSRASIDFKEDGGPGFNGVIHKHPAGMKNFSGTDDKYINQNYMFSLIYTNKEIVSGIVNLEISDGFGRVQLPVNIEVEYPHVELDLTDVNKIKKIPPKPVVTHQPVRIRHGNVSALPSYQHHYQSQPHVPVVANSGIHSSFVDVGVEPYDDDEQEEFMNHLDNMFPLH